MKPISAILSLLLCSCAVSTTAKVTSHPSGANVYVKDRLLGTTPCEINSDQAMPHRYYDGRPGAHATLIFRKPGFIEYGYPVHEWGFPDFIHANLEPVR